MLVSPRCHILFSWKDWFGNIAFISWVIEDEWPYVGGRSTRAGLKCAIQSLHTVDSLPLNHLIAVPLMGFMNLRSPKCSL